MISQCPNCKTRFIVSEEKLHVADGNVRCGACMQVFSATDYTTTEHSDIPADHAASHEWLSDLLSEAPANTASKQADHCPADDPQDNSTDTVKSTPNQNSTQDNDHLIPPTHHKVAFELPPIIEAPPIEMAASKTASTQHRLYGSIGLCLCLLLLLAFGQHWLLAHPKQFKDHPQWQAIYRLACEIRHCKQALSANDYQTQSLRIISHPEQVNALLLKTVIINTTKRQLPFPVIEVSFSDINEQPLTNYSANAAEYLRGELQGAKYLPPATPVHITLKLTDPGPAAINYAIKLK